VLQNFVSNAVHHTKRGFISIKCDPIDQQLRIAVTDSGPGIPADKQQQIFEEYYQLDNDLRNIKNGLGLGLSIVKNIARLLDCPIDIDSKIGVGSTFSIIVPLATTKIIPILNDVPEKPKSEGELTVLVVDDDESVVKSTARLLSIFKMQVHTALSGDEALATISQGLRPDVIVSDFRLPRFDGIELINRVRSALRHDLPAIIMSGDTSSQKIKQAELANFIALSKPVDPEQLRRLIQQGIDS